MSTETNIDYKTRLDRFNKALTLKSPDRVLVGPSSDHFFSTKLAGISNKDAMLDHDKRYAAMKEVILRFDFDIALQSGVYPAQWYSILGARHYQWPGGALPDDKTFQFVEKEYLLADEYGNNPEFGTKQMCMALQKYGIEGLQIRAVQFKEKDRVFQHFEEFFLRCYIK